MESYLVYYDAGTTNTRGYLLKREGESLVPLLDRLGVLVSASRKVGSKDVAAAGDNQVLLSALWEIYGELLRKCPGGTPGGGAGGGGLRLWDDYQLQRAPGDSPPARRR